MKKLIIASHNQGKVKEIRRLLACLGIDVVSASDLNLPEPEETGTSFIENAKLKSDAAAIAAGEFALADDSGICIPALGDAPGIYSARWAGESKDFLVAMQRIYNELKAKNLEPNGEKAYFICVLALSSPNKETKVFEGRIDGTLSFPASGNKGFGYDPIFIPEGHQKTFADMSESEKHEISHRSKAFAKLMEYLNG